MGRIVHIAGIYEIRCRVTGTVYIGSSKRIDRRWWQHRHDLIKGRHWNAALQAAWHTHGESAFAWTVLEEVADAALAAAEKRHLDAAAACGPVFNCDLMPRGNERPRRSGGIDWSAVDWSKSNKQIARELGCSETPVANHRPASHPSPGSTAQYLSARAKQRLAALPASERMARGRRLYESRTAEGEARRLEACRRARSKSEMLAGADWQLSNRELARRHGISRKTVAKHRPVIAAGAR